MLLIAICGPPNSGKSTVQKILWDKWDVKPIDDGRIIRDLVKRAFNLSEEDVSTHHGKSSTMHLKGSGGKETLTNRELLGKLARGLESEFGEFIVPMLTVREECRNSIFNKFSFGSVRRNQGQFYKDQGGIVIEVINDEKSIYDFDNYDRSIIDYQIVNDGSLEDLEAQVTRLLEDVILSHKETPESIAELIKESNRLTKTYMTDFKCVFCALQATTRDSKGYSVCPEHVGSM